MHTDTYTNLDNVRIFSDITTIYKVCSNIMCLSALLVPEYYYYYRHSVLPPPPLKHVNTKQLIISLCMTFFACLPYQRGGEGGLVEEAEGDGGGGGGGAVVEMVMEPAFPSFTYI